jgi:hypothetical protein
MPESKFFRSFLIISLLFALAIPFIPITELRSTIFIDSASPLIELPDDLVGIEFPATRQKVELLEVTLKNYCSFSFGSDELTPLFHTGLGNTGRNQLKVDAIGQKLVVRVGDDVQFKKPICSTNFSTPLTVELNKRYVTVTNGFFSEKISLNSEPFFSILVVNQTIFKNSNFVAEVHTFTYATHPNPFGWVVRFLAFTFLLLAMIKTFKYSQRPNLLVSQINQFGLISVMMACTLLAWALFGTPLFDDGWFAQIFQHPEEMNFYNIFNTFDGRMPLGQIWYLIQSSWVSISGNLLWTRLLSAVFAFVAWYLVYRAAIRSFVFSLNDLVIGSLVYLVGSFSFLVSNRPESFISLLISFTIYFLATVDSRNLCRNLFITGMFCGLSLSTHLSGVISLAILIAWFAFKFSDHSRVFSRSLKLQIFALPLIVVLIVALLNTFLFTNLQDLSETRSLWASTSEALPSWRVRFISRITTIFTTNPVDIPLRRLFAVTLILCLAIFGWIPEKSSKFNWIFASFVFSIILFSLTPSIGPWQLGSFTPLLFLVVLMISSQLRKPDSLKTYFFITACVSLLNMVIWASADNNYFDLQWQSEMLEKSLMISRSPVFWFVGSSMILMLHRFVIFRFSVRSRVLDFPSAALLSGSLLFCLLLQLGMQAAKPVERSRDGTTRQALFWLKGFSNCGLSSKAKIPDLENLALPQVTSNNVPVSDKRVSILNNNVNVYDLSETDPLVIKVSTNFDYVLLFVRSAGVDGLTLRFSKFGNLDEVSEISAPSISFKSVHGFSPVLIELTNFKNHGTLTQEYVITSDSIGSYVLEPMVLPQIDVLSFKQSKAQISSELAPYYQCLEESYFSRGLSTKPTFLIGGLPSFPQSPAAVFDDYLEFVPFTFDDQRGIKGRLFLPS